MTTGIEPGARLANGALVIMARCGYVLAHVPQSADPWVTWCVTHDGVTYSGHYFADYLSAEADLFTRSTAEVITR